MKVLLILFLVLINICDAEEPKRPARFVMRCNDERTSRLKYSKLVAPVPFKVPKPGEFDHIFYTEFLGGCDIDRACVVDLVDAMKYGNDAYVKHYLHPGTVYYLPAAAKNPKTWIIKQVLDLFDRYNVSSSHYTLVHVADETPYWNSPQLISFYRQWKKVYRQTWHFSKEYTALIEVCWAWVIAGCMLPLECASKQCHVTSLSQPCME